MFIVFHNFKFYHHILKTPQLANTDDTLRVWFMQKKMTQNCQQWILTQRRGLSLMIKDRGMTIYILAYLEMFTVCIVFNDYLILPVI